MATPPANNNDLPTEHPLKRWKPDEQSLLEELLIKYASDPEQLRYEKISLRLPAKTAIDIALRCKWMEENAADRQVASSSDTNSSHSDNSDYWMYKVIEFSSRQLLAYNEKVLNQISANFSASKVHENVELFAKVRNYIRWLLNQTLSDDEITKKMLPLPVELINDLANNELPPP